MLTDSDDALLLDEMLDPACDKAVGAVWNEPPDVEVYDSLRVSTTGEDVRETCIDWPAIATAIEKDVLDVLDALGQGHEELQDKLQTDVSLFLAVGEGECDPVNGLEKRTQSPMSIQCGVRSE